MPTSPAPPRLVEPAHARAQAAQAGVSGTAVPINSEALFRGASELQIEHRGSLYRLRQTSLGKLILTK